jgi:hypothetical protein
MNLGLVSGNIWLQQHRGEVGDFYDALRGAMRWHCYDYPDSAGKSANHISVFVDEWLRTQTLRQIVKLSSNWHKAIHSELENTIAERGGTELSNHGVVTGSAWPLVLKEPFNLENYQFTELSNEEELIQEGRLMQHCVGTYGKKCTQENALIFSVVDQNDLSRSTLELAICNATGMLNLVSHKGICNANPNDECQEVAFIFVNILNTENFVIYIKSRQCFQRSSRAISEEIRQMNMEQKNYYQKMTQRVAWECCFGAD